MFNINLLFTLMIMIWYNKCDLIYFCYLSISPLFCHKFNRMFQLQSTGKMQILHIQFKVLNKKFLCVHTYVYVCCKVIVLSFLYYTLDSPRHRCTETGSVNTVCLKYCSKAWNFGNFRETSHRMLLSAGSALGDFLFWRTTKKNGFFNTVLRRSFDVKIVLIWRC